MCGAWAASGFVFNTAVRTQVPNAERSDASSAWDRQISTGDKTSVRMMSAVSGGGSEEQLSRRGIIAGERARTLQRVGVALCCNCLCGSMPSATVLY